MDPKRVAVSGASGFIGAHLIAELEHSGCNVIRLVRRKPKSAAEVQWNPESLENDLSAISGVDAVIHLGGESVASGRWTRARKKRLRESRVGSTRNLASAIRRLERPPRVVVIASAIGFYGDRGEKLLDESSSAGKGFLPELAVEWERAGSSLREHGIRVVNTRFGIVLSKHGGALKKMLLPFRLGLGGPLGQGDQFMSWISLRDAVSALRFCLANEKLSGPVNVVAPCPVRNEEFTSALKKTLHRPAFFRLPEGALHLLFGQMADELFLSSTRVAPRKLYDAGFQFTDVEIKGALRWAIKES